MTIQDRKAKIRAELREPLKEVHADIRQAASEQAQILLARQSLWQKAKCVLLFAPLASELNFLPVINEVKSAGKIFALPRFNPQTGEYQPAQIRTATELISGAFGILEPPSSAPVLALNQLDFALIPGIAFDEVGRRLGRGRGFYDRMLAEVHGWKCGVGFDFQVLPEIPVEPHDVLMNLILTPTRWLEVRPKTAR